MTQTSPATAMRDDAIWWAIYLGTVQFLFDIRPKRRGDP
jgi:hypothetical protein